MSDCDTVCFMMNGSLVSRKRDGDSRKSKATILKPPVARWVYLRVGSVTVCSDADDFAAVRYDLRKFLGESLSA